LLRAFAGARGAAMRVLVLVIAGVREDAHAHGYAQEYEDEYVDEYEYLDEYVDEYRLCEARGRG
jgi:hypothetical protein